jgi:hypothetical protein
MLGDVRAAETTDKGRLVMRNRTGQRDSVGRDVFDGIITGVVSLGAWMALDDITTDTTSAVFTAEWMFLAIAAAWGIALTLRVAQRGRTALAAMSALFLIAALWGQQWAGPGTVASWRPPYVALAGALLGFGGIALALLAMASRASRSVDPGPA